MSKKVIHVTTVHPWQDIRIFHKECKTLAKAGFDVNLIAGHTEEVIEDGVEVVPIPKITGKYKRLLGSSFKAYQKVIELTKGEVDKPIIHLQDPELLLLGFYLKRKGYTVIYDVHEDVPRQILTKEWLPKLLRSSISKWVERIESKASKDFAQIIAAEPVTYKRFIPEKTTMVQNFPISSEFAEISMDDYHNRPNNLFYVGGITEHRGIFQMLDLMGDLDKDLKSKLILGGRIQSIELENKVRNNPNWASVDFRDWMDRPSVLKALSVSKIGLVLLHKIPNYMEAYPTKLLEYMAAGLPVVSTDIPLWSEIVKEADCGIMVDPHNRSQVKEAVEYILKNPEEAKEMGERGRKLALAKYSWESEGAKLVKCYYKLTASE